MQIVVLPAVRFRRVDDGVLAEIVADVLAASVDDGVSPVSSVLNIVLHTYIAESKIELPATIQWCRAHQQRSDRISSTLSMKGVPFFRT